MKRRVVLAIALLMAWPMITSAKPKERIFAGTQQQVFEACLAAARENYVINYVDEKHFLITFEQGGGVLHSEIAFNAVVGPEKDGKVTVSLNYQGKKGKVVGGNLAGHFFDRVAEALEAANKKP